ncbi:hypothetical protein SprV_0100070300 [Sparganum proliferum]
MANVDFPGDIEQRDSSVIVAEVGHREGGLNADNGDKVASPKRRVEAHQTTVGALRWKKQLSHDVIPDGKGEARVPSLFLRTAAPEKV